MKRYQFEELEELRAQAYTRFKHDFKEAGDMTQLVQAYATYNGKLEALIDMVEVIEMAKITARKRG